MSFGMVAASYLHVSAWPDYSGIAPSYNQPTITTTAVAAGAATTIAGSAGWLREKRVGVAENSPGGSQTSTNAPDLTGSTRFAYPGLPAASAYVTIPASYILSDYKPGGSSQNAYWLMTIDLVTDATEIEYRVNATITDGRFGLVCVDGLRVDAHPLMMTSPPNAGLGAGVKLTFPDSRERRITVYGLNQTQGRFGGVAVNAGASVTKASTPSRMIVVLGDSYVAGSTGASAVETFAWQLALKMGADCVVQAGIGGTGFINDLAGEPTSSFDGRVADILAMNPAAVIVAGGRNDVASGLQAAVESLLSSLSSVPERYVMPTASESGQAGVRTAIQAACAVQGVPYLNVAIDALEKIGDGIHPTYDGHQVLAADAFARIVAL